MSYTKRSVGHAGAMGDSLSDLLKCGKGVVGAVIGGVADPYIPEILCRVSQLNALTTNRTPLQAMFGKKPTVAVPSCASPPLGANTVGIGRAIRPLRALVYVNRHPTTAWLGLTALLGIPMLVGYMIGRKTR